MLAIMQIVDTEETVYTCPSGKKAFVYVDIASNDGTPASITIKVGTGESFYVYWIGSAEFVSAKLALTAGYGVRVAATGTVNVFVHGMEQ